MIFIAMLALWVAFVIWGLRGQQPVRTNPTVPEQAHWDAFHARRQQLAAQSLAHFKATCPPSVTIEGSHNGSSRLAPHGTLQPCTGIYVTSEREGLCWVYPMPQRTILMPEARGIKRRLINQIGSGDDTFRQWPSRPF
jgi:hypothetical protein